jgi:hypothetical protein
MINKRPVFEDPEEEKFYIDRFNQKDPSSNIEFNERKSYQDGQLAKLSAEEEAKRKQEDSYDTKAIVPPLNQLGHVTLFENEQFPDGASNLVGSEANALISETEKTRMAEKQMMHDQKKKVKETKEMVQELMQIEDKIMTRMPKSFVRSPRGNNRDAKAILMGIKQQRAKMLEHFTTGLDMAMSTPTRSKASSSYAGAFLRDRDSGVYSRNGPHGEKMGQSFQSTVQAGITGGIDSMGGDLDMLQLNLKICDEEIKKADLGEEVESQRDQEVPLSKDELFKLQKS